MSAGFTFKQSVVSEYSPFPTPPFPSPPFPSPPFPTPPLSVSPSCSDCPSCGAPKYYRSLPYQANTLYSQLGFSDYIPYSGLPHSVSVPYMTHMALRGPLSHSRSAPDVGFSSTSSCPSPYLGTFFDTPGVGSSAGDLTPSPPPPPVPRLPSLEVLLSVGINPFARCT